jgi:hypothetical protein
MPIALAALAAMTAWWWYANRKAAEAHAAVQRADANVLAAQAVNTAIAQSAAAVAQGQPSAIPMGQPTGGQYIMLIPGLSGKQSYGSRMGDSVTIALPPGSVWITGGNGGNAPISWVYQGPGDVQLGWVNSDGSLQMSNLSFYTLAF